MGLGDHLSGKPENVREASEENPVRKNCSSLTSRSELQQCLVDCDEPLIACFKDFAAY